MVSQKKVRNISYEQMLRFLLCLQKRKIVTLQRAKRAMGGNVSKYQFNYNILILKERGFEIVCHRVKNKKFYYMR